MTGRGPKGAGRFREGRFTQTATKMIRTEDFWRRSVSKMMDKVGKVIQEQSLDG